MAGNTEIETVNIPSMPLPTGHYSAGVKVGSLLFVSGQLPTIPGRENDALSGSFEEQALQALSNFAAVVAVAGLSLDRIVSMTIYVTDITLWAEFNSVYAEIFGKHRPARAIVTCAALHFGAMVEIQGIAAF